MTLLEAMGIAQKTNLRLFHKELGNGELVSVGQLGNIGEISIHLAISNEWRIEPRLVQVREDEFRAKAVPVIRKYLPSSKVDDLALELAEVFFPAH